MEFAARRRTAPRSAPSRSGVACAGGESMQARKSRFPDVSRETSRRGELPFAGLPEPNRGLDQARRSMNGRLGKGLIPTLNQRLACRRSIRNPSGVSRAKERGRPRGDPAAKRRKRSRTTRADPEWKDHESVPWRISGLWTSCLRRGRLPAERLLEPESPRGTLGRAGNEIASFACFT